jgi:hypothetical protein
MSDLPQPPKTLDPDAYCNLTRKAAVGMFVFWLFLSCLCTYLTAQPVLSFGGWAFVFLHHYLWRPSGLSIARDS